MRAGSSFLILLLASASAACSVFPGNMRHSVDQICTDLLSATEKRQDLGPLRVMVFRIHQLEGTPAGPQKVKYNPGPELEHEVVVSLAPRLNIVESEYSKPGTLDAASGAEEEHSASKEREEDKHSEGEHEIDLQILAERHNATVILVGDWSWLDSESLTLSLRLVDVRSGLVIGAARGVVLLGY